MSDSRPHRGLGGLLSLLDVVPTLVDTLGLQIPRQGREQFEGIHAMGSRTSRNDAFALRTFRRRREWSKGKRFSSHGPGELYDMRADRAETVNLVRRRPQVAVRLEQSLKSRLAKLAQAGARNEVSEEASAETLEKLRALGYLQ